MAFPNIADEIAVLTKQHIVPGIIDGVFKHSPLLAYMKANGLQRHRGSTFKFQENFTYKPMIGGAYTIGTSFDISKRRTLEGATFDLKHHFVNVTEQKEHLQIYNKGPEAVFKLIEADLNTAAQTMSAILAIEAYGNGIDAGSTAKMNGLAEAINDGTTASYNGNTYANYGGVTRSSVSPALTAKVTNVNGPLTYKALEEGYNDVGLGAIVPNLRVTTRRGLSYLKEKFHPQMRVTVQDPKVGFNGIQFNQAIVMQDSYCPGAQGTNDADLGNYLDADGETLWMLVTDYLRMWVTDDPEFGFGFSGFKWAQDSTTVAGQYFASVNITCQAPRLMHAMHTITG